MNDSQSKFVKKYEVKGSVRTVFGVMKICQDDNMNWSIYSVIGNSSGHLVERINKHNVTFSLVDDVNKLIQSKEKYLLDVMTVLSNRSETWLKDDLEGMGFKSSR